MNPQNQNNNNLTNEWSTLENKLFEHAFLVFPEETSYRWQKIADRISGKSAKEVEEHFDMLLHDVYEIEAGRIEIPRYADDSSMLLSNWNSNNQIYFTSKSKHQLDNERKEGSPWTEEEHK
ncbi:hypothetical protein ERO13_D05G079400v2 [Gossypium hirsutum]|uniref:Protein RADIALIS-like 4 n=6 Tax=Gossypium TaxID=3633 RepID=A0ABM3A3B7_GOSHI|nr:protein RADIALIS-like 4 [Gossypium hirsutum]KAB2028140.1 hypothetical protein ES319_D05G078800v1 [Gossypium barbadense]TYH69924.1 hypothetical protein ES332_D05G084500v1 [Gossypium tomentosum]TYI80371.1 hypothetical protein E1A91_D05G083000v1 [Gossypium mustelinum]KAG4145132.1 hypothetical protein ERO13_D05G079400v2 [Gossypium hirsutum]PPD76676.1 hypothetical protein GOBAR_DD26408 [Gossypium barbadense]